MIAAHGPVALAAARVMHSGRFVVIKKSRLAAAAAAGCAAHTGKSANALPEHQTRIMSDDIEASSMDSESKMDSSWKLARRVRPAVTTVASST
jgi:hypothetical protein